MKRIIVFLILFVYIFSSAFAESISIPADVTVIQENAFYNDVSIKNVMLPDTIKSIESHAFQNTSLKKVFLPESLESISNDAFDPNVEFYVIPGSYAHQWTKQYSKKGIPVQKMKTGVKTPVSVEEELCTYVFFVPEKDGYYLFSMNGYDLASSVYELELFDGELNLIREGEFDEDYYFFDTPLLAGREYILGIWSNNEAAGDILAEHRCLYSVEPTDDVVYVNHWDDHFSMSVEAKTTYGNLTYQWYRAWWEAGEGKFEKIEGATSPECVINGPFTESLYFRCIITDCYGHSEKADFSAYLDY